SPPPETPLPVSHHPGKSTAVVFSVVSRKPDPTSPPPKPPDPILPKPIDPCSDLRDSSSPCVILSPDLPSPLIPPPDPPPEPPDPTLRPTRQPPPPFTTAHNFIGSRPFGEDPDSSTGPMSNVNQPHTTFVWQWCSYSLVIPMAGKCSLRSEGDPYHFMLVVGLLGENCLVGWERFNWLMGWEMFSWLEGLARNSMILVDLDFISPIGLMHLAK
ncbi:hypothetical protein AALP_AAs47232U000100, partial [Arabis alpina]